MSTKDFLLSIETEVRALLNKSYKVDIASTTTVPNVEDSGFNLGSGELLKAKTIDTCVLFIDIRKSTQLNFDHSEDVLAKLYASFIKSMLKAAEHFGGKVRNINGDRAMVVFDTDSCFKKAIDTACLMNTISKNIIDKNFTHAVFECGIGIDYGRMLVVKTGTIKQGDENQFYKSFVWLGKPANLSSKLTDLANKENAIFTLKYWSYNVLMALLSKNSLFSGLSTPQDNKPALIDVKIDASQFAENLSKPTAQDKVKYNFGEAVSWTRSNIKSDPILITEEVYKGLQRTFPKSSYFTVPLLKQSNVKVKGYSGKVYGLNGFFIFK